MNFGLNVTLKTLCPKGARLKIDKLLEELISKYEVLLKNGSEYISEMNQQSNNYQTQNSINAIWKIILNDLREIAEKAKHDHQKRQ